MTRRFLGSKISTVFAVAWEISSMPLAKAASSKPGVPGRSTIPTCLKSDAQIRTDVNSTKITAVSLCMMGLVR